MNSKTITQQIAELQRLQPAELAQRYEQMFSKPPRVRNAAWLRRQVAWKLQEQQLGGLGERAKTRLAELMAQVDLPLAAAAPPPRPRPTPAKAVNVNTPIPGTVLVREWRDRRIEVHVTDDGFAWNGTTYSSLSAVAKAITGAAWNGRLFFGLTTRKSAS